MNDKTTTSKKALEAYKEYKNNINNINTWGTKLQLLKPATNVTSLYYSGNSTLIINIHGDAFCFKSALDNDAYCHYLNATYCATVLNVDFTPSCVWGNPVQLTEICLQIEQFLKKYGGFTKIIVVGHSSGANLAVALVAKWIENKKRKVNALVLDYPWLDLTIPGEKRVAVKDMWSDEQINDWIKMYCPKEEKRQTQEVSPIYTDELILSEFPSTYVITCEKDRFKNDGDIFSQKLFSLKVNVRHVKIPQKHGYIMDNMALAYKLPNDPNVITAKKTVNQEMVYALMAK